MKIVLGIVIGLIALTAVFFVWNQTTNTKTQQGGVGSVPTAEQTTEFADTSSNTVEVKIVDYEYIPKNIRVKKGTKVTWINEGSMQHNVMLDHEDSDNPHVPEGEINAAKLESALLSKGESYSFVFTQVSNNPYHCAPHPWMKGLVEVVE